MSSTESSPVSMAAQPTPEQAAQDALSWRQGLKRLLTMEAIDSFVDSFAWEKDEMQAQAAIDRGTLTTNGVAGSTGSLTTQEENKMRVMVAGNLTVQRPAETPAQPPTIVPIPAAPSSVKGNGWVAPLVTGLLGAALAGGGAAIYNNQTSDSTPPPAAAQGDWKLGVDVKDRSE